MSMVNEPAMTANFELSVEISAPLGEVWRSLIDDIGLWWPPEFFTSDKTKSIALEPFPGGRLFEDYGEHGGLLWYHVVAIEKESSLLLSGYLLPPFGGPAVTSLRVALAKSSSGVILTINDAIFGAVGGYDPVEDWRLLFEGGFKTFVERPKQ
ncbi:hypothetical protein [Umboniibacter marinipuniceus]|uniref:Activator of Hsp90 ATPase-like protein n=1 Tax=Umboniibacter marinipuniceus TaxID=569599 RepID=A0A3M0A9J8_9GAMM|nr:hypothetical protein [Umboniibacter marinipuniceus]RMA80974.1 hypothetical protein DFR27_0764 [Umboniibacter marinipuniceus]